VLFITAYHHFDRENLFRTLDMFGEDITWTHVEHPAAPYFFDPKLAANFDVFLFFDAYAGRRTTINPDGTRTNRYEPPSAEMQANLKALLTQGNHGFVMLHHSIASWVHTWPPGVNGTNAYVEMMGGAADWGTPLNNIRGVNYPRSGWRHATEQRITVVDKTHPVTAGVEDFFIIDEPYLCPMFEDSVHCLTRTNFVATVENFADGPAGRNAGPGHPRGSNMTSWVKTAENTPLVYIQHGHDNYVWSHPAWRRMVVNAIKWTHSSEGKAWAKANMKRIFV
jgi:type 1 glutamine amidotransferase